MDYYKSCRGPPKSPHPSIVQRENFARMATVTRRAQSTVMNQMVYRSECLGQGQALLLNIGENIVFYFLIGVEIVRRESSRSCQAGRHNRKSMQIPLKETIFFNSFAIYLRGFAYQVKNNIIMKLARQSKTRYTFMIIRDIFHLEY